MSLHVSFLSNVYSYAWLLCFHFNLIPYLVFYFQYFFSSSFFPLKKERKSRCSFSKKHLIEIYMGILLDNISASQFHSTFNLWLIKDHTFIVCHFVDPQAFTVGTLE
jgi:hypothetical protein